MTSSRKTRAKKLLTAARRIGSVHYHSCSAVGAVFQWNGEEDVYAYTVGVDSHGSAFAEDFLEYNEGEKRLARQLAVLMYRQAVLAKKELA